MNYYHIRALPRLNQTHGLKNVRMRGLVLLPYHLYITRLDTFLQVTGNGKHQAQQKAQARSSDRSRCKAVGLAESISALRREETAPRLKESRLEFESNQAEDNQSSDTTSGIYRRNEPRFFQPLIDANLRLSSTTCHRI